MELYNHYMFKFELFFLIRALTPLNSLLTNSRERTLTSLKRPKFAQGIS